MICDDGSTDNTPEVCARYDDSRIRTLRFKNGGGQAANFNRCLQEARGELVCLLHADDYFLPDFLQNRVAQLQADSNRVLAAGAVELVDDQNQNQGVNQKWETDQTFGKGEFLRELLMACIIVPVSMVFRADAAQKAGEFRRDIVWGPDWEWAIRLAHEGGVFYDATPRAAYRVHVGSGTASALNKGFNGPNEHMMFREAFERLKTDPIMASEAAEIEKRANWRRGLRHMAYAEQLLAQNNRAMARANLRWALRAAPTLASRPTFWAMQIGCAAPKLFARYRQIRGGAVS